MHKEKPRMVFPDFVRLYQTRGAQGKGLGLRSSPTTGTTVLREGHFGFSQSAPVFFRIFRDGKGRYIDEVRSRAIAHSVQRRIEHLARIAALHTSMQAAVTTDFERHVVLRLPASQTGNG